MSVPSGFYLLAKVEEAADKPIYKWTHHIVSGHTLKHLCAAMVPVFLTLMLAKRSIEIERFSSHFFSLYAVISLRCMNEFVEGCQVLHFTFFHLLSFSLLHTASNLWLVASKADEIGNERDFSLNTNFCFIGEFIISTNVYLCIYSPL